MRRNLCLLSCPAIETISTPVPSALPKDCKNTDSTDLSQLFVFQQNLSCPGNGLRGQGTEKERGGERISSEIGGIAGAGVFGKVFYFKGF
jgi:hypothetical protein